MHDQYKTKVRKLTEELIRLEQEEMDGLQLLNCREQELIARKDMVLWEKNNEKVQVRPSDLIRSDTVACDHLRCAYFCLLPLSFYCFPCFWPYVPYDFLFVPFSL